MGGRDGCDGTYEVGAYGMEWVHKKKNNREPDRSRVTSKLVMFLLKLL